MEIKKYNKEINNKLKCSLGCELGWSLDQILWSPIGFSKDLTTYQQSSYPGDFLTFLFITYIGYIWKSDLLKLLRVYVYNNPTVKR